MDVVHNVLWVNFDGVLCFFTKSCTFEAKNERNVSVTLRTVYNLKLIASKQTVL